MPSPAIEHRGQLTVRPGRISLPHAAKQITNGMRHIERWEAFYVAFVEAQEPPTGREIVVHNIENLSLDSRSKTGKNNGIRTIINVGKRNTIAASEMHKHSERVDSDTSGD